MVILALVGRALGVLMAIYALRTFATCLIWVTGSAPAPLIVVLPAVLGLAAGFACYALSRSGATAPGLFSFLLAICLTAQVPTLRVLAGAAAFSCCLRWLAGLASHERRFPEITVVALGLDVTMRYLLGGLDLPFASQTWLIWLLAAATALLSAASPKPQIVQWPSWTLAAWIFLQVEWLSHPGRVAESTTLSAGSSTLLILSGLCAAIAALNAPRRWRRLVGSVGILALLLPLAPLTLVLGQAGLGILLQPCHRQRINAKFIWPTVLGLAGFLYGLHGWPVLFPATAVAVGLASLRHDDRGKRTPTSPRAYWAPGLTGILLLGFPAIPVGSPATDSVPVSHEVSILSYNIHHAMDDRGMPAPERLGNLLAEVQPDIIALQEVTRGWPIMGASDLVHYLSARLPDYDAVFGPVAGDIWGTLLLSRLPVVASGYERFPGPEFRHTHGFTWAMVQTPNCQALVVNVHLVAGAHRRAERESQMGRVLEFIGGRPCAVLVGDTNAEPGSTTMELLWSSGFADSLGQPADRPPTFPAYNPVVSIDYVAPSADWQVLDAKVLPTRTSDHRPILVKLLPGAP